MSVTLQFYLSLAAALVGTAGCVAVALWLCRLRKNKPKALTKEEKRRAAPRPAGVRSPMALYKEKFRRALILLIATGILTLAAGGHGGYLFCAYALPPADFIDTGLWIAEEGYQDDTFTVDGVVYERLSLEPSPKACDARKSARLCYRPAGLFNRYLSGNYYHIANDRDLDLLWNGQDRLFAPADEANAITDLYRQNIRQWYLLDYSREDDSGDPVKVPAPGALAGNLAEAMLEYWKLDQNDLPVSEMQLAENEYFTLELWAESDDGLVQFSPWVVIVEGRAYIQLSASVGQLHKLDLRLLKLPDAVSAPLVAVSTLVSGAAQ